MATTVRACTFTSPSGKTARTCSLAPLTAGLSETALYYIGGIIKHAKALNAITNPGTNSYKRLVPHYEAPVKLAYSAKNRSASIRIPHVASDKGRRIETRFPDPLANPYLCFSALMMAGLDGIQNKIHPGDPADKNLYDLPPEEDKLIPTVCASLEEALAALDADREFLTRGGVFSNDFIDAYIELKMDEVNKTRMTAHPVEFPDVLQPVIAALPLAGKHDGKNPARSADRAGFFMCTQPEKCQHHHPIPAHRRVLAFCFSPELGIMST